MGKNNNGNPSYSKANCWLGLVDQRDVTEYVRRNNNADKTDENSVTVYAITQHIKNGKNVQNKYGDEYFLDQEHQ